MRQRAHVELRLAERRSMEGRINRTGGPQVAPNQDELLARMVREALKGARRACLNGPVHRFRARGSFPSGAAEGQMGPEVGWLEYDSCPLQRARQASVERLQGALRFLRDAGPNDAERP